MKSSRFIAAILPLFLCTALASGKVTVKREPIDVQYKTFDPEHPPEGMPHLNPGESAITSYNFRILPRADYEVADRKQTADGWTASVDVHGVVMTLQLHVVVYTPIGASDKLKAHEEGHRKISEQVYQERAISAARTAGALLDGKTLTGQGPDWKKAAGNAVIPPAEVMAKDYLKHTADIAEEVNDIYDELTQHGTNDKPEAEAIKEAFAKSIANHPTTRPTK
jgi:hypothetical protein